MKRCLLIAVCLIAALASGCRVLRNPFGLPLILGAALLCGCSAIDSLIVHPLKVVHEQHEYNERAGEQGTFSDPASWPKRTFTNDNSVVE